MDILAESSHLTNVRVLHAGTSEGFRPEDSGPLWYSGTMLMSFGWKLWDWLGRMPRLEELYLHASTFGIADFFRAKSLTHLRVLQVYLANEYPLAVLARNRSLGRLTHLSLRPPPLSGATSEAPLLRLDDVFALVRSPHLRSLTHLRLQQTDLGDEGCRTIVDSGILGRLKLLDLARGAITDEGARTLAGCPDLSHLEVLDVSHNALTPEGVNLLRARGIEVRAGDQHDVDDTYYLYEGDYE
jgi:hypothetical protein